MVRQLVADFPALLKLQAQDDQGDLAFTMKLYRIVVNFIIYQIC